MKEGFEGFCEMPGLQDESKISDDIVQKISNNRSTKLLLILACSHLTHE